MTYDNEIIKQTWLVEGTIAYSEEQVVEAFNEVQVTLGQEWLDSIKFSDGTEKFGAQITISIVELGLKLSVLKRGINYASLITKIKSNLENEVAKGMAELNAIYFICNEPDIDFELEPQVPRQGKTPSHPDFRVKKKNVVEWTYVEVKQPDTSEHNIATHNIISKIISLFQGINSFLSVEIMLLYIPNEEELNQIVSACSELFGQNKKTELEIENLGMIKVNHNKNIKYEPFPYPGFNTKPVLGKLHTQVDIDKDGNSVLKKLVVCRIATSDERARRFLIDASEQLPPTTSNLIWIDGHNVPSIKNWAILIAKQFADKPLLNKKVSGLITFSSGVGLKDNILSVLNTVKLTENSTADFLIPNWIKEKLCVAG